MKKALLLAADLLHVEMVDAGVGELLQRGDVLVEVGAAGHRVGHHLLGHQLTGLLEVGWLGQHLGELAGEDLVGP